MSSQNGSNSSKTSSIIYNNSEFNGTNTRGDWAYRLPTGVWEKILMYVGCESWCKILRAYPMVQDVISSVKLKEIEKCKKCLKKIPYEFFVEFKEISGKPKNTLRIKIIESYINHWKFNYPEKVRLSQILYSNTDPPSPVDYMNISGSWAILYTENIFKMVHLDLLSQKSFCSPLKAIYVEKFLFLRSSGFTSCACLKGGNVDCWCNGDLSHDYLQMLLPINMRIMQSGAKPISIQLHSFQIHDNVDPALPGYFHVTSGRFRLSFSPYFGFDEEAFASHVKNPVAGTYVFEGDRRVDSGRRLLDISVSSVPPKGDIFRAILLILDQSAHSHRLLFLEGPKILFSLTLPPLTQAMLYRGSLLIGLCSSGNVCFLSDRSRHMMKSTLMTHSFTCLDLRGNLLAIGTRNGSLLLYHLRGRPIDLPAEIPRTKPKIFQVTNDSIYQLRFIPTAPGPELLFLTNTHKLYRVKLVSN